MLRLDIDGAQEPQFFTRLDALPSACGAPNPEATPQEVFDAFWVAMNENYAFFETHGVDWQSRQSLRPENSVTDAELFDTLTAALSGLNDGHISLFDDENGRWFTPFQRPDWAPRENGKSRADYWATAADALGVELTRLEGTPIHFGITSDGVGYIQIHEMTLDTGLLGTSRPIAEAKMVELLGNLKDAKALMIDVRFNTGGMDDVSFGLASPFAADETFVLTKTTRVGDGQSPPFRGVLKPSQDWTEKRPTLLLTSGLSHSAAEIFAMAMRELPSVTLFGEPTSGELSDIMDFVLPNGWGLGLSNQTYRAADGVVYEAAGIPVDVAHPFEAEGFADGRDDVVLAAHRYALNKTDQ